MRPTCIVRLVLEADRPKPTPQRVLDLYAGSGLFTLPLAARGHHVTAVEENRQAIEDAEANMRLNRVGTDDVRLHPSRVEDALPRLGASAFDRRDSRSAAPGLPAGGDSTAVSAQQTAAARSTCPATRRRSPRSCRTILDAGLTR